MTVIKKQYTLPMTYKLSYTFISQIICDIFISQPRKFYPHAHFHAIIFHLYGTNDLVYIEVTLQSTFLLEPMFKLLFNFTISTI